MTTTLLVTLNQHLAEFKSIMYFYAFISCSLDYNSPAIGLCKHTLRQLHYICNADKKRRKNLITSWSQFFPLTSYLHFFLLILMFKLWIWAFHLFVSLRHCKRLFVYESCNKVTLSDPLQAENNIARNSDSW